ncbi:MAG: TolC family protein [Bacteroidota bacterium]
MKKVFFILCVFLPSLLQAQQTLLLRSAIDSTLRNSFDIRIARNNTEINTLNYSFGNAGGLPSVGITVSDNTALNTPDQKFKNGSETNYSNSLDNNVNAGIYTSMTLFNGFKIIADYRRLRMLQEQSELLLNDMIQSKVADVMIAYFDIIRQQRYLKIIESTLAISEKKLEIVQQRDSVGMASGVDIMQAQMDVNIALQNQETQKMIIEQSKTDLLALMSSKTYYSFIVDDSISVDPGIGADSVLNALKNNPQYMIAEKQTHISEQLMKEVNAQRYPSVKISAGYNFDRSESDKAALYFGQVYGPSAGLTLQIPIYNGNAVRRHVKAARIEIMNAQLRTENTMNDLTSNAVKAYQSYSTAIRQLNRQQENYILAGKLMNLVLENFQVRQATILDVKAAQSSFENAAYSLVNTQYVAKLAEIQLQSLIFKLKY